MRIAFIHPRYPSAEGTGATHSATQVVNGLSAAGHNIDVYCPQNPEQSNSHSEFNLYHLSGHSSHPHTDTQLNKEVSARRDKLRNYDIVHSYLMRLMPSVAQIGKDDSVNTIITLNAYGGTCAKNDLLYDNKKQCQSKSTRKCIECIARSGSRDGANGYSYQTASRMLNLRLVNSGESRLEYIDAFRAPSSHVKNNYTSFGYSEEKISVIPHPVDEDFLIPHESDFEEPYNLLYVGALETHKGVDKLIPILSSLNQTDAKFTLTVIGTGPLEKQLQNQVREYGVTQFVDLRGFVPNKQLPKIYAAHDCFVYPGIWEEPLARVYLESMATGTPIVTSEYGSITEIIGGGGTTTDGSVEDFVQVISDVVDQNQLQTFSEQGKQKIEEYDLSNIVSELNKLYSEILNKK